MMHKTRLRWLAGLVLLGCSNTSESVDSISEAIGSACVSAPATATFDHEILYTSPHTYTTTGCSKAVVLDVTNFRAESCEATAGVGGFPGCNPDSGWGIVADVKFVDTPPTNQADCEASSVIAYRFSSGTGGVGEISKRSSGRWMGGFCFPAEVVFTQTEMPRGQWYRFAVSGRQRSSGTSATGSVKVETFLTPQVF